jgi:hypothetical protein
MNYQHDELIKTHVYLGEKSPIMPGIGMLQKIAFKRDIVIENIRAYRVADNEWRVYRLKGKKGKYVTQPMLPKGIEMRKPKEVKKQLSEAEQAMEDARKYIDKNLIKLCKQAQDFRDSGVRTGIQLNSLCEIYKRVNRHGWLAMTMDAIKWAALDKLLEVTV